MTPGADTSSRSVRGGWRAPRTTVLLLALAASAACDEESPVGPAPAVFEVVMGGAGASAAAMLFLIEGGPVDSVEANGWFTASAPYSGVATQVVVAGPTLAGAIVLVHVPDGRTSYRAVVREVAEAGTHALLPTADYSLTLVRRRS
jgi:hypothetical protein